MTDFENRIRSWRAALGPSFAEGRAEVVDELESHLRDALEAQTRDGRSPDEAWAAALERLGEPKALAAEFRKSQHAAWLPARAMLIVLGVCGVLLGVWIWPLVSHVRGGLLASHVFAITFGYAATFAFGLVAAAAILARAIGSFGDTRERAFRRDGTFILVGAVTMTFLGFVLGAAWSKENRGPYWSGNPREIGAVCVFVCNALSLTFLRRRNAPAVVPMVCGLAGNVIVTAAWFGTILLITSQQASSLSGFQSWYRPLLLASFVLSQFAIAGIAWLMPPGWRGRHATGQKAL